MDRIDTFIEGVTARTGMSRAVAASAAGGLLVNVMEKVPPRDAEAMLDLITGTEAAVRGFLAVDAAALPISARGLGNFRKPRPDPEPDVFEFLGDFGVPHERAGTFVSAFLELLDERVGPQVARNVARQLVI